MSTIVVYDGTGMIVRSITDFNESLTAGDFAPYSILRVQSHSRVSKSQYYVLDGELTDRPNLSCASSKSTITADGVDSAVVSDVPVGSAIVVTGGDYTVDGDAIEVTATSPGEIFVDITPPFPSKPLTISVIAA